MNLHTVLRDICIFQLSHPQIAGKRAVFLIALDLLIADVTVHMMNQKLVSQGVRSGKPGQLPFPVKADPGTQARVDLEAYVCGENLIIIPTVSASEETPTSAPSGGTITYKYSVLNTEDVDAEVEEIALTVVALKIIIVLKKIMKIK